MSNEEHACSERCTARQHALNLSAAYRQMRKLRQRPALRKFDVRAGHRLLLAVRESEQHLHHTFVRSMPGSGQQVRMSLQRLQSHPHHVVYVPADMDWHFISNTPSTACKAAGTQGARAVSATVELCSSPPSGLTCSQRQSMLTSRCLLMV